MCTENPQKTLDYMYVHREPPENPGLHVCAQRTPRKPWTTCMCTENPQKTLDYMYVHREPPENPGLHVCAQRTPRKPWTTCMCTENPQKTLDYMYVHREPWASCMCTENRGLHVCAQRTVGLCRDTQIKAVGLQPCKITTHLSSSICLMYSCMAEATAPCSPWVLRTIAGRG